MLDINLYFDNENIENNVIENPLHLFIQEIELSIKTSIKELWGFRYALDLEKYVFNKYITLSDVNNEISSFITKHCSQSSEFPFDVDSSFLKIEGEVVLYIILKVHYGQQVITQKFYLA